MTDDDMTIRSEVRSAIGMDYPNALSNKHSHLVFQRLRNFLNEGLFCDVTVLRGKTRQSVPAHRVVLLSSKSFDSDSSNHSDVDTTSESDEDGTNVPTMALRNDSVFEEAYASDEETHAKEHMDNINNMRLQGECCDVTLEASGKEFKAHRCVLAAASDYFKAMFTSKMKEERKSFIELKELCFDEVHAEDILNYIYTGEMSLDEQNIFPILCLATYYQISTLTETCQNYLLRRLSPMNCCESYIISNSFALEELKQESMKVIHDHFPEIEGSTDDLLSLQKLELDSLLSSDTLGIKSVPSKRTESRILSNVCQWLTHANFRHSAELLSYIRFPLIPRNELLNLRREIHEVSDETDEGYEGVENFFKSALIYHDNIYEQPLLQSEKTQLREEREKWICVDGVLAPEPVKLPSICHNAKSPTDEQTQNKMHEKIRDPFHSVTVLNGFVYTIGGTRHTSTGYSNEVLRYDSRLDSWIKVAAMIEPRGDFFACTIDNHLYVFGGKNKRGALQSCERYDPRHDRWERISDLPDEGLYMTAGVIHDGKVYIAGGFNEYESVGKTLRYDPDADEWETLPTMLFKDRGYHVMLNDGKGYIWAIGGVDNPFAGRNVWDVERFNIEYEMWEYYGQVLAVQPFLSVQRLNAFVDERGNICVFAVTNVDDSPTLRLNFSTNMWERLDEPIDYFEIEYDS